MDGDENEEGGNDTATADLETDMAVLKLGPTGTPVEHVLPRVNQRTPITKDFQKKARSVTLSFQRQKSVDISPTDGAVRNERTQTDSVHDKLVYDDDMHEGPGACGDTSTGTAKTKQNELSDLGVMVNVNSPDIFGANEELKDIHETFQVSEPKHVTLSSQLNVFSTPEPTNTVSQFSPEAASVTPTTVKAAPRLSVKLAETSPTSSKWAENVQPLDQDSISTAEKGTSTDPEPEFESSFERDFHRHGVLGYGGFGICFDATHKIDKNSYAVKRISLSRSEERTEILLKEVRVLCRLKHPNIVVYNCCWIEKPPLYWQESRDQSLDLSDYPFYSDGPSEGSTESGSETSSNNNNNAVPIQQQNQNFNLLGVQDQFDVPPPNENDDDDWASSEGFSQSNTNSESSSSSTDSKQHSITGNEARDQAIKGNFGTNTELVDNSSEEGIAFKNDSERANNVSPVPNFSAMKKNKEALPKEIIKNNIPRQFLYVQMELCEQETLKGWLQSNAVTSKREKKIVFPMFHQIVAGVEYIHGKDLIHRDLKPANIFFSRGAPRQIKIGDFGLVKVLSQEASGDDSGRHTEEVGTEMYRSPEQFKGSNCCKKADMFSLGVILFEMLVPFGSVMERHLILTNVGKQDIPEEFKVGMEKEMEVVQKLTSEVVAHRLSAAELHGHEMFWDYKGHFKSLANSGV